MKQKFYIVHNGDSSAGINSYYEEVTILVRFNLFDTEEFKKDIKSFLKDWFDGAKVLDEKEAKLYFKDR